MKEGTWSVDTRPLDSNERSAEEAHDTSIDTPSPSTNQGSCNGSTSTAQAHTTASCAGSSGSQDILSRATSVLSPGRKHTLWRTHGGSLLESTHQCPCAKRSISGHVTGWHAFTFKSREGAVACSSPLSEAATAIPCGLQTPEMGMSVSLTLRTSRWPSRTHPPSTSASIIPFTPTRHYQEPHAQQPPQVRNKTTQFTTF